MAFSVDVLTPSKVLGRGIQVDSLFIPTERGVINVLKDHTHIITKLETGLVTCISESGTREFIVTTGIAKVMGDKIQILTNVGEESVYVDKERALAALKSAKERLAKTDNLSNEEIERYQMKLRRAELRIAVAESENS